METYQWCYLRWNHAGPLTLFLPQTIGDTAFLSQTNRATYLAIWPLLGHRRSGRFFVTFPV